MIACDRRCREQNDPSQINWAACGAQYLAEATGIFLTAVNGYQKVVDGPSAKDWRGCFQTENQHCLKSKQRRIAINTNREEGTEM